MFMNAFITAFSLDIFYHIWYNKVKSKNGNKKGIIYYDQVHDRINCLSVSVKILQT